MGRAASTVTVERITQVLTRAGSSDGGVDRRRTGASAGAASLTPAGELSDSGLRPGLLLAVLSKPAASESAAISGSSEIECRLVQVFRD